MLRKIFGPRREEVSEDRRAINKEELYDLYFSRNIIWMIKALWMRWAEHAACMGEGRGLYRILTGKPEGKKQSGRPRSRWENNIKMDLTEIGQKGLDWINLAIMTGSTSRGEFCLTN